MTNEAPTSLIVHRSEQIKHLFRQNHKVWTPVCDRQLDDLVRAIHNEALEIAALRLAKADYLTRCFGGHRPEVKEDITLIKECKL